MQRNEKDTSEMITIDLTHIWRMLKKRMWVIALAGILAAAVGFTQAAFFETPKYSSSVLLYVNNSSGNMDSGLNISASDLSASEGLVNTFIAFLSQSRTTMEQVIEETGVSYSAGALRGMISASSVQNTQIMRLTVVATDPYEAAKIANGIAEVLPTTAKDIAGTVKVLDPAVPNLSKISPSVTRYTFFGLVIGVLLSGGVVALLAVLDNTINDEEYVLKTYNYPLLAKIPDLLKPELKGSGYYMQDSVAKHKK